VNLEHLESLKEFYSKDIDNVIDIIEVVEMKQFFDIKVWGKILVTLGEALEELEENLYFVEKFSREEKEAGKFLPEVAQKV